MPGKAFHARRVPTILTLLLALGGPPLLAIVAKRVPGQPADVARLLPYDLLLWAIFALVVTVVVRVDRQSLADIGLRRPRWSTIGWALGLFVAINLILSPTLLSLVTSAGLRGLEEGLMQLLPLPAWYRVFAAVSAGIIEETLYRGYAVERLAWLTGSYWIGGAMAVIAFGLAHLPLWGLGPSLVFMADGAAVTLFYLWRGDLSALIVAHAVGDTMGLVLLPPINPVIG